MVALAGVPILLNAKFVSSYYNGGNAWRAKGDLDRAIADYNEAILLNPKYAKSYYNRGVAWEKKRGLQEALSDFEAYSQLVPSDPDGPAPRRCPDLITLDVQAVSSCSTRWVAVVSSMRSTAANSRTKRSRAA